MLSENIRKYRKQLNLSQDELAEKLGVSRQSVSFWETGQTQPTIDNIIALAKVFNISTDVLLGNCGGDSELLRDRAQEDKPTTKKSKLGMIIAIFVAAAVIIGIIIWIIVGTARNVTDSTESSDTPITNDTEPITDKAIIPDITDVGGITSGTETEEANDSANGTETEEANDSANGTEAEETESDTSAPDDIEFDLFSYCKNIAIEKGNLVGDYCIYQEPAAKYGGYDNEYFSITYWSDSDMVEFGLHCPLSDTYSHNFYLRMRGGYNGKYEYASSKYFRDTGERLRSAYGYIDPAVFYDGYPIPCDQYDGELDGQDRFMEDTRVGICDLIRCLKKFVEVENLDCDFSDFDFSKF